MVYVNLNLDVAVYSIILTALYPTKQINRYHRHVPMCYKRASLFRKKEKFFGLKTNFLYTNSSAGRVPYTI